MTLSYLRDSITKRLQERVDAAAGKAINMRVNAETSADGYALIQADTLSEARAYAEAAKIVIEEYKRLTETTGNAVEPDADPHAQARQKDIY